MEQHYGRISLYDVICDVCGNPICHGILHIEVKAIVHNLPVPMIFHIHRREYDLMDWKGKQ